MAQEEAIIENRAGIFQEPQHTQGGFPTRLIDTGRPIEVEGGEFNFPEWVKSDKTIYTLSGKNYDVIRQIFVIIGAQWDDKVTHIKSGDMIICIRSAFDDTERTYIGTLHEILSAINTSCGCRHMEGGATMVNHETHEVGQTKKSNVAGIYYDITKVGSNKYLKIMHIQSRKPILNLTSSPVQGVKNIIKKSDEILSKVNWNVPEKDITDEHQKIALELKNKIQIDPSLHRYVVKMYLGGTVPTTTPTLNSDGGYDYEGKEEKTAKKAGLITLPKKIAGTNCSNCIFFKNGFCDHEKVLLPVNNRMCCTYWNYTSIGTIFSELPNADFFPDKKLKDKKYPLNDRGGYEYDGAGLDRAKDADLITLPTEIIGTTCAISNCQWTDKHMFCTHPKVQLAVTDRMTCGYWNNEEVIRSWGAPVEHTFKDGGEPKGNKPLEIIDISGKHQVVDFNTDDKFSHLFFGNPTKKEIDDFNKWLKKNRDTYVRLYHGTSSKVPVLTEGLKPTSRKTAKSLQSGSGFVYLSVYPSMSKQYADLAYSSDVYHGVPSQVYAVDIPVKELKPDKDNLANKRMYGSPELGSSLGESLAVAHSVAVPRTILPYELSIHHLKMINGGGTEEFSEDLIAFLGNKSSVPAIGEEKGKKVDTGISKYTSEHGSYRYVKYVDGIPVAVLQIVSRDGIHGQVANVYTVPKFRRKGFSKELLSTAKKDFTTIGHSDFLSISGKGFKEYAESHKKGGEAMGNRIAQGYVITSYKNLKKILGDPNIENEKEKIGWYMMHDSRHIGAVWTEADKSIKDIKKEKFHKWFIWAGNPESDKRLKDALKLQVRDVDPIKQKQKEKEISEERWKKKRVHIQEMSNNIHKIKTNVARDLNSDDEKEVLTALVVAVMLATSERVGNEESMEEDHCGVTGFQKRHVTVIGNKVLLDYTGKSGVKHEKSFTDKRIAKALKKAIKNSPSKFVFETSDKFRIKCDKVNRYLEKFDVTAKNIRGFNANAGIIKKLKYGGIPEEPKQRKKLFNAAIKKTAGEVGHGASTLKKHYMIPELHDEYILNGTIIDMKNLGYYQEAGDTGEEPVKEEKKYLYLSDDTKKEVPIWAPATSYFLNPHVIPDAVNKAAEALVDHANDNDLDIRDVYASYPIKQVEFKDIVPMQDDMDAQKIEDYIKEINDDFTKPFMLEYQGKYYLSDGHHRTIALYLNNKPIMAHVYEIKGDNSSNSDDFANSKKIINFTQNATKDEIKSIISGEEPVSNGTAIQAASDYLRKGKSAGSIPANPKQLKQSEESILRGYSALIPISDLGTYFAEGTEHKVYLHDEHHVIKTNSCYFYNSWEDYFTNLLLHNYFFPDTSYELIGFTEENGKLFSVVKQIFVETIEKTDLNIARIFLTDNGFVNTRNDDYFNEKLGIILEDLHAQNIVIKEGFPVFIDTIFYIADNAKAIYRNGGDTMSFEEFSTELEKPKQDIIDDMQLAIDKLKLKYDKINNTTYYSDQLAQSFPLGRVGFESRHLTKLRDRDLEKTIDNAVTSIQIKRDIDFLESRLKSYQTGKSHATGMQKTMPLAKLNDMIASAEKILKSGEMKGVKMTSEELTNLKDIIAHWKKQRRDKEKKHKTLYDQYLAQATKKMDTGGNLSHEQEKEAEKVAKAFIAGLSTSDLESLTEEVHKVMTASIIEAEKDLEKLASKKGKLDIERNELAQNEKGMSYGEEKNKSYETRLKISFEIAVIESKIRNQQNVIKILKNKGDLVSFTDKKGQKHTGIPSFIKVNTDLISFDEETILTDVAPPYIPTISEEAFRSKGYVFDAIRIAPDVYILAVNGYTEDKDVIEDEEESPLKNKDQGYILITLDQLALINDYYFTKEKALLRKQSDERNKRMEEAYDALTRERRESFLNQKGFYHSIPASVKKQYTKEQYEALSFEEKEALYKPFKRAGVKRLTSKLEDDQMWKSFHHMYERFVDPEATEIRTGELQKWVDKGLITAEAAELTKKRSSASTVWGHPEVFAYWKQFRDMMKWKIKDIQVQRAEMSEVRKIALETSFGESNTNDELKDAYGILVKRQDGSKILPAQIEQIRISWERINKTLGNLVKNAKDVNLKISHTGVKYVFASKAAGMFIPDMKTIAVSNKFGDNQFESIMAHEVGHWIDYSIGKLSGKRYLSDDFESGAGVVAITLRNNMNAMSDSDYVNSTAECFARAMEQYFAIENFGEDATLVYSYTPLSEVRTYHAENNYVSKDSYNNKLKPLIKKFLSENESYFSYTVNPEETPKNSTMKDGGEIIIYQAPNNPSQVEVRIEGETLWMTQKQMAEIFQKEVATINEHIKNIYQDAELQEVTTIRKNLIVQKEGNRDVKREVLLYNLDVILSVGYRVDSKRGTQFRIWATQRLKDYLVKGYAINEQRLLQSTEHIKRVENLIEVIKEAKREGRLKLEENASVVELISSYTKAFTLFSEVDTDSLKRQGLNENIIYEINYDDAIKVVDKLQKEVREKGESTPTFGIEEGDKLKSAIGAVSQTFGGKYLYPSVEEQAANLLYMVIEGHVFKDGNKRNGSLLFIWFLEKNNYSFKDSGQLKINDNGLVLLALLLAQSKGRDKEFYIDLTINLLSNR